MSNRFDNCEEFEAVNGIDLIGKKDEDHHILYYLPTSRSDPRLSPSTYSSSSSPSSFSTHSPTLQLISSFSTTATPTSAHTPKRMVHFLEDPSPIDDDALDITILGILSSEDRYGILSPLSRLLEKPLRFSTIKRSNYHHQSNHHTSNKSFEIELNRRLRQLSNSSFRHKRWSSNPDLRFEESLLELISDRLELRDSDSNSKGSSSPTHKDSVNSQVQFKYQDNKDEDEVQNSWFIQAGAWVFDTLSFVPWYSISSLS
ncbi:uncharacterized protein MELLADRAFT_78763 [Melampsora larici-populina 98AG31]|uniref:Uncharacterized protein n=1 Tax=Melampsora larici-populina (strain 98AG31 / pathotype 3-4-7) TaxID=747676 RepID=F4RYE4_MELLP|nr:uncharacterized protein MELLADRAFT_78763 [Melampsora larici-populina 98AG31]EGG02455.1 hypothetical protein MELLADRAFT_78763 [Melampsora larici-populina 98AG31]